METSKLLDIEAIRADFPILIEPARNGAALAYLDNAASTQRPVQVLDRMREVYERAYGNVHRGSHFLSDRCTELYEQARETVRKFVNARDFSEIIFTRGTTEGINLVASSWGDVNLSQGDEILLCTMEHHSNIVPWQQLAKRRRAHIRWLPTTPEGLLALDQLESLLSERTKVFAFTAASNVLGTINPVMELVNAAHRVGAVTVVDAAQAAPHEAVDVQAWNADFVAFSGHKLLGPTGIGVLYGKKALLEAMPPYQGGGSMIHRVTREGFEPAALPAKFEAGTPAIVPAIALATAMDYLNRLGLQNVRNHELALNQHAFEQLSTIQGIRILGPKPHEKTGLTSFVLEGVHANDIAEVLDSKGVAVRAGHHCAMPLHAELGISASLRASFYIYNTPEEVERLIDGVRAAVRLLR